MRRDLGKGDGGEGEEVGAWEGGKRASPPTPGLCTVCVIIYPFALQLLLSMMYARLSPVTSLHTFTDDASSTYTDPLCTLL